MKYLSVCSGMEAASVAWHPLGWTPVGFSEIEPFPCAILKHRFPNTPNYGSLTEYQSWPLEPGAIDLLVGGTPCQSFSVAGLRKGLADPRGNLALTFLGLADKLKPRWIVWENVPGVLSSGGGRDFGSFLGALVELGYGFAYRVLDAQYVGGPRAVPQRRRRVFVVAHLGDWRPAAAVLFEPESLRRDIKKGRKKGEGIASSPKGGVGPGVEYFDFQAIGKYGNDGSASTLMARDYKDAKDLVIKPVCATGETTHTLTASPRGSEDGTGRGTPIVCATGSTAHALTASCNKGATEDGTGRGTPIVIDRAAFNQGVNAQYEPHIEATETMDTLVSKGPHAVGCYPINTLTLGGRPDPVNDRRMTMGVGNNGDPQFTLQAAHSHAVATVTPMAVRRLTPEECEALQGFPKGYSRIPWKGKPADQCPDGPRYKACGNSMAVPVMRWIGERIAAVDSTLPPHA
jgi:DNA (cytosine-5)-methyltransferase 1